MKCQGKRWSLSWMRSWNCGLIQYPLLMKYSLLFGTILELCLWVILIEIAQCCEAGDWSRAWIPVVLGSGWQGPVQSFLSEVSFMTFPTQSMWFSGFLVPPKQPSCYTFIPRTLLGAQKNLGAGSFYLTYLPLSHPFISPHSTLFPH